MHTSSDTRLEWPVEGSLFESDSNKRQGPNRGHYSSHLKVIIEVRPAALFRYDTHQTISGRLEQVYLQSDPRLEWPGEEGPLFKLNLNKCWGQNLGTIRSPLGHYLCQAWDPWPDKAPV